MRPQAPERKNRPTSRLRSQRGVTTGWSSASDGRERLVEERHDRVRLIFREDEWRREANGVPAGAEDQHTALEHLLDDLVALGHGADLRRPVFHQLDANHEALAADV